MSDPVLILCLQIKLFHATYKKGWNISSKSILIGHVQFYMLFISETAVIILSIAATSLGILITVLLVLFVLR